MTAHGFVEVLGAVLDGELDVNEAIEPDAIKSATRYRDTGLLTRNDGLLVRLADGTEFQVTVVRSRRGSRPGPDENEE